MPSGKKEAWCPLTHFENDSKTFPLQKDFPRAKDLPVGFG